MAETPLEKIRRRASARRFYASEWRGFTTRALLTNLALMTALWFLTQAKP